MTLRKCLTAAGFGFVAMNVLPAPLEGNHPISSLKEFRPIGGAGNNLVNPSFNAVPGSPEITLAPLNFAPGSANGLVSGPNPRLVSNVIAGGTGATGQDSQTPDTVASAWLYVFGQFVDHDLSLERTLREGPAIDIVVPPNDPTLPAGSSIAMTRDIRHPATNTAVNTVAGYLDLSQLYGSVPAVALGLRNTDGTLRTSNGGQAPPIENDRFVGGDPRLMENPELTAATTLFMREHNLWVERIRMQNPSWSGDRLYDMARSIVTAEYQNIVYREFLPVLLGPVLGRYGGYDPTVNAQVTQEFTTAAFRVGHSQVSEEQTAIDNHGVQTSVQSLAQSFFNTATEDLAIGFNGLMRNLGEEFSQATDVYAVPVLRNLLFTPLVGGNLDAVDLIAIDIQRERDVGLGSLNQTRKALGLPVHTSFAQLTGDEGLRRNFEALYRDIDAVDLFMGGLAERHAPGATVGPTFQAIIKAQFSALRSGDRFFWENQGFDDATATSIRNTTLADVIKRNTDTTQARENLFVLGKVPPAAKPHARQAPIDNHGRRGAPFMIR